MENASSSRHAPRKGNVPLHILCLHDAHSNAEYLQAKLHKLSERLWHNHAVQLVFVNAPLVVNHDGNDDDSNQRVWWQATEQHRYLGLDASLGMVQQMWRGTTPFWGVLGIGQGAALAALLTLWLMEQDVNCAQRSPPQCAIFVDGYTVLPEDMPLLSIQQLQSLHILSSPSESPPAFAAASVDRDPSSVARLVTQMGGQTHVRQVAEHWSSTDCLNRMGRYLVQQKMNHANHTSHAHQLMAVQQALVATEQDAARLVQQHALQHPPPSLMAVIGGPYVSGRAVPKPVAPAGGAPFSSDFCLPLHKRKENDENSQPGDGTATSNSES